MVSPCRLARLLPSQPNGEEDGLMKFVTNTRIVPLVALPLVLAACGGAKEDAPEDEPAEAEAAAAAATAAPEAIAIEAGNWQIKTDVWKVEGEGLDAEAAKAMRGQKAKTAACIDRAGSQRSYVAVVEAAIGSECQQTGTSAEAPKMGADAPRLRGALSCKGGDGGETPASFVADDLQPARLTGSLERTATAPDGSGEITMHINVQATRTGDCP
jgi:hypothetical protein